MIWKSNGTWHCLPLFFQSQPPGYYPTTEDSELRGQLSKGIRFRLFFAGQGAGGRDQRDTLLAQEYKKLSEPTPQRNWFLNVLWSLEKFPKAYSKQTNQLNDFNKFRSQGDTLSPNRRYIVPKEQHPWLRLDLHTQTYTCVPTHTKYKAKVITLLDFKIY